MKNLDWLQICAEGQTDGCVQPIQIAYLIAVLVGGVLLIIAARRSRDLTTSVLTLMGVAIAINITVGSITVLLRLPIYLDSIGTVLVGALAGPWAGALTGILSNLIWSILPVPGGAGPIAAFFAPVAGVIGLMAGFWASRGVFQIRSDDPRVGGFLSLAAGIAAAAIALIVVGSTIGLQVDSPDADVQNRSIVIGALIFVLGFAVTFTTGRSVFKLDINDPRVKTYLVDATAIAAFALLFGVIRLLFSPAGYFSRMDGKDPDGDGPLGPLFGGADLTGLAFPDPAGLIVSLAIGLGVAFLVYRWARSGNNARLFPVWVGGLTTGLIAAMISAPISAGAFGGVTGGGTDALVALFRTLGLNVLQSAFAQGLTSDPLDKTISYTLVFVILGALPVTLRTMYSRGEATVAG